MHSNNPYEPKFNTQKQGILKYDVNGSTLKLSSLSEFYRPVDTSGLAIKFVVDGNERYLINKQPFVVPAGSYLLLNGEKDANVEIESKRLVNGICIHIAESVITDTMASILRPDTPFSDPDLASFLTTDLFLENQYRAAHTLLGHKLLQLNNDIKKNSFSVDDINSGLFFELSEKLILDQIVVLKQLQSVPGIKSITKRDLCRRLTRGREYLDTHFTQPLTIEIVAKESFMSEFHFFRLFRKVYGLSPYQYVLKKRLQASVALLKSDKPVSDVALECGFTDIFTFSKAFKKHFGVSPSYFCKRS